MCFNPKASLYLIYKIGIFFFLSTGSSGRVLFFLIIRRPPFSTTETSSEQTTNWSICFCLGEREGRAEPALSLSDAQTERDLCTGT